MIRACDYCNKEYTRRPSVIGRFCSNECKGNGNIAQQKNLTYRMAKGHMPWNKGNGRIDIACPQCGQINSQLLSQKQRFCNKQCFDIYQAHKSPKTYGTLHAWVRKNFGTPNKCEHCKTSRSKKFEWANISGEYKQLRGDWARLCCRCHRRYDLGVKNKIEVLDV